MQPMKRLIPKDHMTGQWLSRFMPTYTVGSGGFIDSPIFISGRRVFGHEVLAYSRLLEQDRVDLVMCFAPSCQ